MVNVTRLTILAQDSQPAPGRTSDVATIMGKRVPSVDGGLLAWEPNDPADRKMLAEAMERLKALDAKALKSKKGCMDAFLKNTGDEISKVKRDADKTIELIAKYQIWQFKHNAEGQKACPWDGGMGK